MSRTPSKKKLSGIDRPRRFTESPCAPPSPAFSVMPGNIAQGILHEGKILFRQFLLIDAYPCTVKCPGTCGSPYRSLRCFAVCLRCRRRGVGLRVRGNERPDGEAGGAEGALGGGAACKHWTIPKLIFVLMLTRIIIIYIAVSLRIQACRALISVFWRPAFGFDLSCACAARQESGPAPEVRTAHTR